MSSTFDEESARRLIRAWLAEYLRDPNTVPITDWVNTPDGRLAQKLAASPDDTLLRQWAASRPKDGVLHRYQMALLHITRELADAKLSRSDGLVADLESDAPTYWTSSLKWEATDTETAPKPDAR